jgi:hypothetical protein
MNDTDDYEVKLTRRNKDHADFIWGSPALKPYKKDLTLIWRSHGPASIEGKAYALRAVARFAEAAGIFGHTTDLGARIERKLAGVGA